MSKNLQVTLGIVVVALVVVATLLLMFGNDNATSMGSGDEQELFQDNKGDASLFIELPNSQSGTGEEAGADTDTIKETNLTQGDGNEPFPEGETNSDEKMPPPQEQAVIIYENNGFSEREIAIFPGATVRFLNSSNYPMWVASDDHPTHDQYQSFDQRVAVGLGGVYEFKFDQPGDWSYHNHMRPADGGVIHVRDN